jgi:iron-regulated transporter 1
MLCASAIGNWVDRSPARLSSLLLTIGVNHAAIMASYICWLYWPVVAGYADEANPNSTGPFSNLTKGFLYGFILLLDIIHDLSRLANRLSVEVRFMSVISNIFQKSESYVFIAQDTLLIKSMNE